jgi:hypothetical protein
MYYIVCLLVVLVPNLASSMPLGHASMIWYKCFLHVLMSPKTICHLYHPIDKQEMKKYINVSKITLCTRQSVR